MRQTLCLEKLIQYIWTEKITACPVWGLPVEGNVRIRVGTASGPVHAGKSVWPWFGPGVCKVHAAFIEMQKEVICLQKKKNLHSARVKLRGGAEQSQTTDDTRW